MIDWEWLASGTRFENSRSMVMYLYCVKKMPMIKIGNFLGVSGTAVRRKLVEEGIQILPRGGWTKNPKKGGHN